MSEIVNERDREDETFTFFIRCGQYDNFIHFYVRFLFGLFVVSLCVVICILVAQPHNSYFVFSSQKKNPFFKKQTIYMSRCIYFFKKNIYIEFTRIGLRRHTCAMTTTLARSSTSGKKTHNENNLPVTKLIVPFASSPE